VQYIHPYINSWWPAAAGNLEAYACERIPEVLGERFGFVLDSCGSESFVVDGKEFEFDAVLQASPVGQVQPLFFGYRAAVVTQRLITGSAAWLIFPRGLVAAA
jgi:hypothetical protein